VDILEHVGLRACKGIFLCAVKMKHGGPMAATHSGRVRSAVLNFCHADARNLRDCRSVELRALCNEVPRTPPGPEGSNGTGIASGAADHPEFLSLKTFP
jgi:hypothetical protein